MALLQEVFILFYCRVGKKAPQPSNTPKDDGLLHTPFGVASFTCSKFYKRNLFDLNKFGLQHKQILQVYNKREENNTL